MMASPRTRTGALVTAIHRPESRSWPWVLAILLVGLAASLPYLQTIGGYFIGDDFALVSAFHQQSPLHFLSLFTTSWDSGGYDDIPDELRPLVALSFQFDFFWGSGLPLSFHISSILFHVGNSLLVLAIARLVARLSLSGAVLCGALFALLPTHAESVSWITGRADSIPAMFYVGSFLCFALWRRLGSLKMYGLSLLCFFLALFSKQSAITMVLTLAFYDLIVGQRLPRLTWSYIRSYLPFVVLTVAYLGLRYYLFGNFVREDTFPLPTLLADVVRGEERNVEILAFGYFALEDVPAIVRHALRGLFAVGMLLVIGLAAWQLRRAVRAGTAIPSRRVLIAYFGPVWWLITVAPLAATYFTPRHLYLPTLGLAIVAGLVYDVLRGAGQGRRFLATTLACIAMLAVCAFQLQGLVSQWNTSATISGKMSRDMAAEAAAAPLGSLLVLGGAPWHAANTTPVASDLAMQGIFPPPGRQWLWSFAVPYVYQPPFTAAGVSDRVAFIGTQDIDCCPVQQWFDRTQQTLRTWSSDGRRGPVIVMTWDASSGALLRSSEVEAPCLRDRFLSLASTGSPSEMMVGLNQTLYEVGKGSGCGSSA